MNILTFHLFSAADIGEAVLAEMAGELFHFEILGRFTSGYMRKHELLAVLVNVNKIGPVTVAQPEGKPCYTIKLCIWRSTPQLLFLRKVS